MNYLLFAWLASIFYALEVVVSKLVSKYSLSNPWLFNFIWSLMVLLFTAPVAYFYGFAWPRFWPSLLAASLFYALSGIFYILALYLLDVSVLSPLFNFRAVISVLLATLLLHETLNSTQLLLMGVIFVSAVLVTLDERWSPRSFFRPAVAVALIDMLSLSLMSVFVKQSVAENGFWTTTFFMPLVAQFILLLTWPKFIGGIGEVGSKNLFVVALIALAGTIGGLASNKANAENVGISSVIISLPLSLVMAFLLSLLFPKLLEKHPARVYLVRFLGAAVMIAAALKLSQGIGI